MRVKKFVCMGCGKECEQPDKSSYSAKYCSIRCRAGHVVRVNAAKDGASARTMKAFLLLTTGSVCSVCSLGVWLDRPITLELDHIDGDYRNNALENVRLLCPNCHSQTPTYKNRNKGRGRLFRNRAGVA